MDVDQAVESQLRNIEDATSRPRADWYDLIRARREEGLKHGQLVTWLKTEHGLTHGNANMLVQQAARQDAPIGEADLLEAQYAARPAMRPVHDAVVEAARGLGPDVRVVVQKTAVSLRRGKQFGVVTPASRSRVDLGLNLRGTEPTGRLEGATGMCTHRVRLTAAEDVDTEVRDWLQAAYDRA
jgi:hypothetical protein